MGVNEFLPGILRPLQTSDAKAQNDRERQTSDAKAQNDRELQTSGARLRMTEAPSVASGPLRKPGAVPTYVWTFLALVFGISLGGLAPERLLPVARATAWLIGVIVELVPLLIFAALSPAVATLVRRGLAGRFAGSVILWYVASSTIAGLVGLVISAALFRIPFSTEASGAWSEAVSMLGAFGSQGSASRPLLAIVGSVVLGLVAAWIDPLYAVLAKVEKGIAGLGGKIGYVMVPLILLFGITLGVKFGARLGMGHYFTMTLYTGLLCLAWFLFYVLVIVGCIAGQPVGRLITRYYLPTALFAAGTCSSLATLPVNLANVKRYGVRDEVADFVVPFGAVFRSAGPRCSSWLPFSCFSPSPPPGFPRGWGPPSGLPPFSHPCWASRSR